VKKVYEKDVKGYVFNCPGGHGFKMGFPKDERKAMCLLQPFLGLQLNISSGEQFSVELSLTAGDGSRRRLFLSSSFQELKATALHAQVPLQGLKWGCWTNLVLNVFSIAEACFPGRSFRSIDHITLGGCFKLRKVFTLKQAPPDTVLQRQAMAAVPIPAVLDFPIGIVCDTQVVDSFFLSAARASAAERRNPQLGGRAEAAEPVSPIKLGVQGEAAGTPAAARSCARQPAPRLYRGGCNTGQEESRIPGPPPSSGQRWAHRQYQREPPKPPEPEDDCAARDDARRAQSAAVQRQAAEATGSVASDEIGPVAEPPGRKVVSAAGGAAATRTRSFAPRLPVSPAKPDADKPADSSSSLLEPISPGGAVATSPQPASPYRPQPVPPPASGAASGGRLPWFPPSEGGTPHCAQWRKTGPSSCSQSGSGMLPGVAGVGGGGGGGCAADPAAVPASAAAASGIGAMPRVAHQERYVERAPWQRDPFPAEDTPLSRHADSTQQSTSPGQAVPARVPPLVQAEASGGRHAKRSLASQADAGLRGDWADRDASPASPAAACTMPPIVAPSVLPGVTRTTSPKRGRGRRSSRSFSSGLSTLTDAPVPRPEEGTGASLRAPASASRGRVELKSLERSSGRQTLPAGSFAHFVGDGDDSVCLHEGSVCCSEGSTAEEVEDEESDFALDRDKAAPSNPGGASAGACGAPFESSLNVSRRIADELVNIATSRLQTLSRSPTEPVWQSEERPGCCPPQSRYANCSGELSERGSWSISSGAFPVPDMAQQHRAFTPPVVLASEVSSSPVAHEKPRPQACEGGGGRRPTPGDEEAARGIAISRSIEFRDLIYDPILNCYYDSRSNQYFSLH